MDLLSQAIDALRTLKATSGHGFSGWHRTYEPAIEKIEAVLKAADVPNIRQLQTIDEETELRTSIGDTPAPQSTEGSPLVSGDSEANKEKG